jgi:ferrochelatase
MSTTAVILINTGTPDSPATSDVRSYLKEFLGDGRVISIPTIPRKILVNGIIVPFRAPKSSTLYQKVWTKKGSPLLWISESLKEKVQQQLGNQFDVLLGMRYGNPSLTNALKTAQRNNNKHIILVPLFPQYASSTTGSVLSKAFNQISTWNNIPKVTAVDSFFNHKLFIESFADRIRTMDYQSYDHILFTYHSLPLKHLRESHNQQDCTTFNCKETISKENQFCYQAHCYETSRLLAQKLSIKKDQYTVCFQSRFSKNWLSPFADKVVKEQAKKGMKKLLVASPSFVTDCLETIVEIGIEYKEIFENNGGQLLTYTPSLNDSHMWVSALSNMILGK